jgi:hypothetical protein
MREGSRVKFGAPGWLWLDFGINSKSPRALCSYHQLSTDDMTYSTSRRTTLRFVPATPDIVSFADARRLRRGRLLDSEARFHQDDNVGIPRRQHIIEVELRALNRRPPFHDVGSIRAAPDGIGILPPHPDDRAR